MFAMAVGGGEMVSAASIWHFEVICWRAIQNSTTPYNAVFKQKHAQLLIKLHSAMFALKLN